MNNESFYTDMDFKYPEIGIALDSGSDKVKVYIPALMPFVDGAGKAAKKKNIRAASKSNIQNKESISISTTIAKNYITMNVPKNIEKVSKNDKLVIVFIAGDPNKPVIIGRC